MRKVLILEDIYNILSKRENIFERSDFLVIKTFSNKHALFIHESENVDMIITKLDMPTMKGDELCSQIRGNRNLRDVSIILVCKNNKSEMERCRNCKANEIITTPFTTETLYNKATKLLNIHKRKSLRLFSVLEVDGNTDNESFVCRTINISRTGVLVETDRDMETGGKVSINLFLPDLKRVTVSGEIVRTTSKTNSINHYGIKFNNISPESKAVLDGFLMNFTGP
jgi:DNA-binding response OmpR family regulator